MAKKPARRVNPFAKCEPGTDTGEYASHASGTVPREQAEAAQSWLVTAMVEGMSRHVRSVPVVVEATIGDSWE